MMDPNDDNRAAPSTPRASTALLRFEVAHGASLDDVCEDFDVTPAEILVALAADGWHLSSHVSALLTDADRSGDALMARLDSAPRRLGGSPCLAGTRRPVRQILEYLEGFESPAAYLWDFPNTHLDDLRAAVLWAERAMRPRMPHRVSREARSGRIVRDPGVMAGVPIVEGTEVLISLIRARCIAGWAEADVAARYDLAPAEVATAMAWPGGSP